MNAPVTAKGGGRGGGGGELQKRQQLRPSRRRSSLVPNNRTWWKTSSQASSPPPPPPPPLSLSLPLRESSPLKSGLLWGAIDNHFWLVSRDRQAVGQHIFTHFKCRACWRLARWPSIQRPIEGVYLASLRRGSFLLLYFSPSLSLFYCQHFMSVVSSHASEDE